ncbi:hypothetical protein [Phenylobacterium sp.]|jgi:hypothetical protein|uniref:hypothetical protein n=1 Tax=Phenylobacterium sp. TaxID=1871053 RepID=UPI002F92B36E
MRILPLLAGAAVLALAACSPKAEKTQYDTSSVDMAELMAHVVDPGAFMVWRGAGTEVTEAGERDLSPTTEEGWKVVEDGAVIVAEAGNLLMLPDRAREPVADWNRHAKLMTVRALEAKKAAEAKDKKGVFDTGGRLYEVCVACHQQFIIAPQEAAEKK